MQIRRKTLAFAVGLITVAMMGYFLIFGKKNGQRMPFIGSRGGDINASSELLNIQQASEYYREQIERQPKIVKNYVQLAQLHLQQARLTGYHHEFSSRAQRLLDRALKLDPENFDAVTTQALLLLKLHRFEEAKALTQKAIEMNSFNAFSWGLLSDALKELGDYEGAVSACDKMLSIRPDLRSYSRAAHLREIYGDYDGARQAMRMACDAGVSGLESRAWTLYQLGELYFKEGKLDTAEYIYRGILQERPDYPHAFKGLAEIKAQQEDYKSAIQFLLRAYEIAPEHEFMEKLVEYYAATGNVQKAQNLTESVLAAFQQHEKQGWNINLEYARFCTNRNIHLDEALKRIEVEFERRPNNVDVLETYVLVLLKNDRMNEAREILERVVQFNDKNPKLHDLAGLISRHSRYDSKTKGDLSSGLVGDL